MLMRNERQYENSDSLQHEYELQQSDEEKHLKFEWIELYKYQLSIEIKWAPSTRNKTSSN